MLGRTHFSPWPLAPWLLSLLIAAPVYALGAEDPFAEPAEPAATSQSPAVEDPAAGQADPFAEDPFSEASVSEDDADPFEETAASDLEDEYGFDPADEFAGADELAGRDPWENFNRAVFRFNDSADRWVLKPLATSYRQVTPLFVQAGVNNFFGNLKEVPNSINSVLQWKWDQAGNDASRFLINSTVGVVGLFDVAEHIGLDKNDGEDFGQTLAVWGMPSGPYLMLPLLGPSTLRDAPGRVVDYYTDPLSYADPVSVRNSLYFTNQVQTRAGLLRTESLLQGDRYLLIRDAYLQRREYLIMDGELEDDFGGDLDDYDF